MLFEELSCYLNINDDVMNINKIFILVMNVLFRWHDIKNIVCFSMNTFNYIYDFPTVFCV